MATFLLANKDCDNGEDRISELPDDVILTFLSPMGMEEAVKTSILSKRWRYLWAKRTVLDFNHLIVFPDSDPDVLFMCFTADQKSKYIKWVNQVVDLHCSPCVDTFRVSFEFDTSDAHHIDKWLRFALMKKVKILELNLISLNPVYTIGFDILKPSIKDLTSLHLSYINVSGDVLECLLSQCSLLEQLYVSGSQTMVRLKVTGLSCKLKQLTIISCHNLKEVEIDAVNLVYFKYYGTSLYTKLVFKRVPMLVEAAFGGVISLDSLFKQMSPLVGHFSKLSIDVQYIVIPAGVLPTFYKVKQLSLQVGEDEMDFVTITRFVEACPVLSEFELEISWNSDVLEREAYDLEILNVVQDDDVVEYVPDILRDDDDDVVENVPDLEYFESGLQIQRKTHLNLKVLQLLKFSGCTCDVDLILYFVVFARNLETIICDPYPSSYNCRLPEVIEASRSRASKLVKIIPPKISVVII